MFLLESEDGLLISDSLWRDLSMEERKVLEESAEQSALLQLRLWRRATREAIDAVRASGTEILHPEKAPFVKAVESVYRGYRDRPEFLNLATEIRAVE